MKDLFDHKQDSLSTSHLKSIQKNIRYRLGGEKTVLPTTTPETRIERVVKASEGFLDKIK